MFLLGLLLAGASGGFMHCTAMCGPFVLGQVSDRLARLPASALCESARFSTALLLPYHGGRILTYAVLGAIAGGAGGLGQPANGTHGLSAVLLGLGALLFLALALERLSPALARRLPLPHGAPPGWVGLLRRAAGRIDRARPAGGFLLGIALGFLPCGMLYAAIAAAAATANAAGGALAMVAFGLGTMPGLMTIALAGHAAGRVFSAAVTRAAPAIMLANAALLAAMAWHRLMIPV